MITFKTFLNEMGGWATTVNQDTVLTPPLVKKIVRHTEKFFVEANKYLVKNGFEPVEFMGPVGSVSYYEKDLKSDPTKEYGDVDTLVSIPRDESLTTNKNIQTYYDLILEFVDKCGFSYIKPVPESKTAGKFIMVKDGDDYVQVDMVFTFHNVKEWAKARYTPEHNVKGALFGNLLSSMAELLHMSIQGYGVQQKIKDGVPVPFRTLKITPKTLSIRPKEFMIDIVYEVAGKDAKIHPLLRKFSGFNVDDVKISDIAQSIKGVAKSLTLNDAYGTGVLKDISDEGEFLSKVADIYRKKMISAAKSTKFDKVTSEIAIEKAKKVKQQFDEFSAKIVKVLTD